ncbi:hypothetical protein LTR72_005980 [Exophiala xenobiotica]|nr:hypothetical protein LTR72_005980 [Exophiala xenobiotica]KAK5294760.1 hypothetical protein LTR14_003928 [Exophiala xenobiotica]
MDESHTRPTSRHPGPQGFQRANNDQPWGTLCTLATALYREGLEDQSLYTILFKDRLPSPAFANKAPPNHSDADVKLEGLENLINHPTLDISTVVRYVSEMLDDSVAPPYAQGWYQPGGTYNEYSKRLEQEISGLDRDGLVREFFFRDGRREPYGERASACARKLNHCKPTGQEEAGARKALDHAGFVKWQKQQQQSANHAEIEQKRRSRHRECQRDSDLRCPEVAFRCGEEHAKLKKEEAKENMGKTQSAAQGSGKDEQLYAAIYAHEFGARVLQSEHDGRKRAEAIVIRLCQLLFRRLGTTSSIHLRGSQSVGTGFHPVIVPRAHNALVAGIKRCRSESEGQRSMWIRNSDSDSDSSSSQTISTASSPRKRHRSIQDEGDSTLSRSFSPPPPPPPPPPPSSSWCMLDNVKGEDVR